jgi:hypothetical protein
MWSLRPSVPRSLSLCVLQRVSAFDLMISALNIAPRWWPLYTQPLRRWAGRGMFMS